MHYYVSKMGYNILRNLKTYRLLKFPFCTETPFWLNRTIFKNEPISMFYSVIFRLFDQTKFKLQFSARCRL